MTEWTCEDCGEIEGVCACPPVDWERERAEIAAANARICPWLSEEESRGEEE